METLGEKESVALPPFLSLGVAEVVGLPVGVGVEVEVWPSKEEVPGGAG